MKAVILTFLSLIPGVALSQNATTDPAFPVANQPLTLTVNATGTSLENYTGDVWIWAWLPDLNPDFNAPTNVNPATSAQDAAKATRSGSDPNVYSITFTPTTFFNRSAEDITRIGFKLKSVDWSDGRQTDTNRFIDIFDAGLQVNFSSPSRPFLFVNPGGTIDITAVASASAELTLLINNQVEVELTASQLNYEHTVTESGTITVQIEAQTGTEVATDEFVFIVRQTSPEASKPQNVIQGINYETDSTIATFCLFAPGKSSVYLLGDFNDWLPSTDYLMSKDGDYFWITVNGLTAGEEYAFQYLVDETIFTGDPYTDKILDPDEDPSIGGQTYPNLKDYPDNDIADGWVSVMQTGQTPFEWRVNDFVAPPKEELVIYELLVRDFDEAHSYQAVINRLDYLEALGVNAIQLMPIMEFSGNLSWGYNPVYFFAPDKYYGTKNDLKTFIDECHTRGMAVILDMVLNHTHERNPIAQLYWDEANFRPSADSPWLNQEATHPFNVFFDFNHETVATQHFVDTVNYYWLEEYRFDGYRFDLSKGFTQRVSADVGAWNVYDQSRVDILKRMTDKIWEHHPEAYVIFEHLGDNDEETVLANHGIMLWGNMNHNFNQLTMGFDDGSNIDWAYHGTRNWDDPNLISYMESHDEERLVFRNLTEGNNTRGGHNTRTLAIALERVKAASALYYAIPGPRMLWQFGELGYDISIDQNGRTGNKPIPWEGANDNLNYDTDEDRSRLNQVTAELIKLKTTYDVFNTRDFTLDESQALVKQITLKNTPYTAEPAGTDEMNVLVVANFNVTSQQVDTEFPHAGTWYNYFVPVDSLQLSNAVQTLDLQPGEFRLYTDIALASPEAELTDYVPPQAPTLLAVTEEPSNGAVQVDWRDNTMVESIYRVMRSNDGTTFDQVEGLPANTTTFLDRTVQPGETHTYKIVAFNPSGTAESNTLEIAIPEVIIPDVVTSIENGVETGFEMYPNPTTGQIEILGPEENYTLAVMDLAGHILIQRNNLHGSHRENLQGLKGGVYFVVIESSAGRKVSRLVKN